MNDDSLAEIDGSYASDRARIFDGADFVIKPSGKRRL
jgi:hypothetical protein